MDNLIKNISDYFNDDNDLDYLRRDPSNSSLKAILWFLIVFILIILVLIILYILKRYCCRKGLQNNHNLFDNENVLVVESFKAFQQNNESLFSIDSAKFLNQKGLKVDNRQFFLKRIGTDPMLNLIPKSKKTDNVFSQQTVEKIATASKDKLSKSEKAIKLSKLSLDKIIPFGVVGLKGTSRDGSDKLNSLPDKISKSIDKIHKLTIKSTESPSKSAAKKSFTRLNVKSRDRSGSFKSRSIKSTDKISKKNVPNKSKSIKKIR